MSGEPSPPGPTSGLLAWLASMALALTVLTLHAHGPLGRFVALGIGGTLTVWLWVLAKRADRG